MQNLIEKKKMYEKHIATILNSVKIDVAVFRQKKMEELELQCQLREKDLMAAAEKEVRTYETRIKVLTDIISEDMPEATAINNLISEENVAEEEVVEEVIEEILPEEIEYLNESIYYVDEEEEVIDTEITDTIPEESEVFNQPADSAEATEHVLDRPGMTQVIIPSRN